MFPKPDHTVSSRQRYANQGELKSPSSPSNSFSSWFFWTEGCSEAPRYLNFLAFFTKHWGWVRGQYSLNCTYSSSIPMSFTGYKAHGETVAQISDIRLYLLYIVCVYVCTCPDYRSRHQISQSRSHRWLWVANWSVFWEQILVFCMNNMHALLTAEPVSSVSGALLGFPSVNRMAHIKCNGFCKNLSLSCDFRHL